MLTRDEIIRELRALITAEIGAEIELTLETDLEHDLELDSMKKLSLIVAIENHFKVSFEPEDDFGIKTINDLVSAIHRHF